MLDGTITGNPILKYLFIGEKFQLYRTESDVSGLKSAILLKINLTVGPFPLRDNKIKCIIKEPKYFKIYHFFRGGGGGICL